MRVLHLDQIAGAYKPLSISYSFSELAQLHSKIKCLYAIIDCTNITLKPRARRI